VGQRKVPELLVHYNNNGWKTADGRRVHEKETEVLLTPQTISSPGSGTLSSVFSLFLLLFLPFFFL
jgi:hypothetical protein